MATRVPTECFWEICRLLTSGREDDERLLHPLLFVCRVWSSCVVPLMWRRPFRFGGDDSSRGWNIVSTFLRVAIDDTPDALRIALGQNEMTRATYDYIAYLDQLPCRAVCEAVWYRTSKEPMQEREAMDRVLLEAVFKAIMTHNRRLSSVTPYSEASIYTRFPGATNCLASVTEVTIVQPVPAQTLSDFAKLCPNIVSLNINNVDTGGADEIGNLMMALPRLTRISEFFCFTPYSPPLESAIKKHARHLLDLSSSYGGLISYLKNSNLDNLRKLKLGVLGRKSGLDYLMRHELPNLSELVLYDYNNDLTKIALMFDHIKGRLRKFSVQPGSSDMNQHHVNSLLEALLKHSSTLEEITVPFCDKAMSMLVKLVDNCENLKRLCMYDVTVCDWNLTDKLLFDLGHAASKSLQTWKILLGHCTMTDPGLEQFLRARIARVESGFAIGVYFHDCKKMHTEPFDECGMTRDNSLNPTTGAVREEQDEFLKKDIIETVDLEWYSWKPQRQKSE